MPTDCPGERMSYEQLEAIMNGKLNYKDGAWVNILPTFTYTDAKAFYNDMGEKPLSRKRRKIT